MSIKKARKALSMLRLRPFDTSTAEGRSNERYRRAGLTIVTTLAARGVQIFVSLAIVRLTLGYLGAERYGMWMAISSILSLMAYVATGAASGVVQIVAEADGAGDRTLARRAISTGYLISAIIGAAALALFAASYWVIPWPRLFNVASELAASEAGPAMVALAACFAINIVINLISRVQQGFQEGYIASAWSVVGQLFGLTGLLFAIRAEVGLPMLVLVLTALPAAANIINTAVYYGRIKRWSRPRLADIGRAMASRVVRLSGLFFSIQVLYALSLVADNFIVAQLLGADRVTDVAVPMKLFIIVQMLVTMLVNALWPAYREALSRGDPEWVRATLRRVLALSLAIGLALSVVFVAFGQTLVEFWVEGAVTPSTPLLVGLAGWTLVYMIGSALMPVLNGAGVLRPQVVSMALSLIAGVGIKLLLVDRWGVEGLPLGMLLGYGVFYLLPAALLVRRALR